MSGEIRCLPRAASTASFGPVATRGASASAGPCAGAAVDARGSPGTPSVAAVAAAARATSRRTSRSLHHPGVDGRASASERSAVERVPHENAATVLVDPLVLRDLEVHLMTQDLRLWPVATAPVCTDGPRPAFQIRRRMLTARRGEWDEGREGVPVWFAFGDIWYDVAEPLPWAAHQALYRTLERYDEHVR